MGYCLTTRTLGQVAEQSVQASGATAAGVVGAALGPGALTAGALAVPIAGGVVAAAIIIMGWMKRRNMQKVAATSVVNEAEPLLQQNLAAFQAAVGSGQATENDRQVALYYFDQVWGQVMRECRAIGGGGGERCVSDRQAGSCVWTGEQGECWNWFAGYRDPIEQAHLPTAAWGGAWGLPDWGPALPPRTSFFWPALGAALLGGALLMERGRA